MKARAEKLGISHAVRFLGNRNDVADLYSAMDVFFMPSRFEGLPISCIEAQATGFPCILSSVITKTVVFTNLIEYIPLKKPDAYWAERIVAAAKGGERRSHNRELCESCFCNESAGEKLKNYYEGVARHE